MSSDLRKIAEIDLVVSQFEKSQARKISSANRKVSSAEEEALAFSI
jgi:hypothetical protein